MKKKPHHTNVRRLIPLFLIFSIGLFVGLKISQYREVRLLHSPSQENNKAVSAKVLYVIDGDTLDVVIDGKKERVRLIGIDAPEMAYEEKQADCFAKQSKEFLREMLDGKTVQLESDPTQDNRDKYERLLRYIFVEDGTDVNRFMIAGGFAREYTYLGIPYRHQKEFQEAELEAKNKKLGLWAEGACSVLP
jgi:micrococcal nuclease